MRAAYLPGHGARDGRWDPGAKSPAGWLEADFVRAVAMGAIGQDPLSIIVSEGSYSERGREAARRVPGAPVIQIHADAVAAETGPDHATVFWWPGNAAGERLARAIAADLMPLLPWAVRVTEADPTVTWHAGARSCLRQVAQTSVLIECGYTDGLLGRIRLPALAGDIGRTIAATLGGMHG